MRVWTYAEALAKVERDMDMQEETFIDGQEFVDLFNEAIDDAEAEIKKANSKYFKRKYLVPIVEGTARYSMPTDIYANKIIYIQFDDGSRKYRINQLKEKEIAYVQTGDDLRFDIENTDADTGIELVLYPTPDFTSSTSVTMYYIRNANQLPDFGDDDLDSSKIDIPEFINFVFAYVKYKVAFKETNPLLANFEAELEKQRASMKETLDNMIPDEDEVIEPDVSFYCDFGNDFA